MDKDRAKRILLAYRPASTDAADPDVAEALAAADSDPSLQLWLQEQDSFHQTVRAELRSIPVPGHLKESILAGRKIIAPPFWRRPEFLLLAACFAVALVVTALLFRSPSEDQTFAGFEKRMVGNALRVYRMDIVTNDLLQVRQFLAARGAPAEVPLTPGLGQTPVKGGAALTWQGHPVGMVCFGLPKGQTLFMFMVNQSAIQGGALPGPDPVLRPVSGVMTATWLQNGRVYLIIADPAAANLNKLLESRAG